MSRAQLALNVNDLDEAITFYSTLFDTPPAKVKPGYANFAIDDPPLKLVLIENPGRGGTLNHLGVEVATTEAGARRDRPTCRCRHVHRSGDRDDMLLRDTRQGVGDQTNRGEKWEVYTVLANAQTFGPVAHDDGAGDDGCVCCASADDAGVGDARS